MTAIEEFNERLDRFGKMWKSFRNEVVLAKKDGKLFLLALRTLLSKSDEFGSRILFENEDLKLLVSDCPVDQLPRFLDQLVRERLAIDGLTAVAGGFSQLDSGIDRGGRSGQFRRELPNFWLRAYGKPVDTFINRKEVDLQLQMEGYDGLIDLSQDIFRTDLSGASNTRIEIISDIPVELKAPRRDDRVRLKVVLDKALAGNVLKVVYVLSHNEDTERDQWLLGEDDCVMVDGGDECSAMKELEFLPGAELRARLFHVDEQKALEVLWTKRPEHEAEMDSVRTALESVLHPNVYRSRDRVDNLLLNLLKLDEETLDAPKFELGILNLFALAGFRTVFLGHGIKAEGVDLIASSPQGELVILVSCSASNKLANKVRTLLPRMNHVRNCLKNIPVIGVVFLQADKIDVPGTDRQMAQDESIVVKYREDIRSYLAVLKKEGRESWQEILESLSTV